MYEELKERCRSCSQGCIYPSECSYYNKPPLRCMRQLLSEAADAIEELQNKLCDWCGVCPKKRRRPSDCEIIYPNMQVPEVAIIPAEEGE